MADSDYGVDFHCVDDVDSALSLASSGRMAAAETVARRLLTPRGRLWYAPGVGRDVRGYINGAVAPGQISQEVKIEAIQDERVDDADVDVTADSSATRINIILDLADGPFPLTLTIDKVTSEVLAQLG